MPHAPSKASVRSPRRTPSARFGLGARRDRRSVASRVMLVGGADRARAELRSHRPRRSAQRVRGGRRGTVGARPSWQGGRHGDPVVVRRDGSFGQAGGPLFLPALAGYRRLHLVHDSARSSRACLRVPAGRSGATRAASARPTSTTGATGRSACSCAARFAAAVTTQAPRPLLRPRAALRRSTSTLARDERRRAAEAARLAVRDLRPRRDPLAADRRLPRPALHRLPRHGSASAGSRRSSRSIGVLVIVLRLGITSAFFRFYFDAETDAERTLRRPHLVLVHDGDGDARARVGLALRRPQLSRLAQAATTRGSSAPASSGSGRR